MAGLCVAFFPEGAFGPTNNCVGIADELMRAGHRCVFVVEESFAGTLAARGFEERHVRLGPPPAEPEVPGQFWKDFIRDTAPLFRRPTIEQLGTFLQPTWQALIDGARYVDEQLAETLDEVGPDVVVQDNVVGFPAIEASGRPWVRVASCNPTELADPDVPPQFSGYPAGDRTGWADFRAEYRRTHLAMWQEFADFFAASGAHPLAELEMTNQSDWLNLYLYPAEADYARSVPLAPTWHRLDACVRRTDGPFSLPSRLAGPSRPGSRLVYLSLGSLGSADVALMQRLIDVLGTTEHRVIVSKGPQHDQLNLPANMWGEEVVPQPSVLPLVDVVVTHGGNNTVTECFWAGKPMVVLPLFWDQYANAQRVHETGFGVRLPTYTLEAQDLVSAVEHLAADRALAGRLAAVSGRLQAHPGTVRAAQLIEAVGRTAAPVHR